MATDEKMDTIPELILEERDGQGIQEQIDEKIRNFDIPYDSSQEPLPRVPAYHSCFARVEKHYEELLEAAMKALGSSNYRDDATDRLSRECTKRRKVQYPNAHIVGLVGDSGVGKSSLINAILDTPDLALAGSTGAACTCVITEYRQAWASQTSTFKAEVVLLDHSKIASLLKGYLHDYWLGRVQSQDDVDQDTLDEIRSRSDTASEVFLSLFATRPEFRDKSETVKFLATMTTAQDEEILSKLLEWLDSTISACGAVDGTIHVCEEDVKSLGQRLKRFVKIGANLGSSATPSLWPIVTVVRIGLRAPLLERGIVVADLPGLSDINRTRTHVTNEYIRSCDYIFLVAPIARVQTDNLVDQRIAEYTIRFGSRVALICTKSDDMSFIVDPEDFSASKHAISGYTQLSRTYEKMGSDRNDLLNKKKAAVGKAKTELGQELTDLTIRRNVCKTLICESVLKMRNRKVERAMRNRHQESNSADGPLRVICISSMAYEVNAAGYNEEDALPVSVDATGIPQLRSLMLELPAKERLDALKTYCWGHLPSLISSMESWSVQATIARRLELREVVAKPRKSAEGVIATLCREIMSHLEKTIVATIRRRKPHWIGEGVKQIRIIEQHTKSTTFRTWCKYDGNHATKACPHWNWNAEFLKPVMEDMGQAWQDFDEACVQTYKHCLAELLGLLNGIRGELSAMGDVVVIPSEPFMKSLAPKKRQLQAAFEVFSTKLQRFSSLIRLNVITDDTEESYLLKALVPVYRSCVEESGKGSSPRRVAKLRTAMMRGEPFAVIEPGVKASMKSELETRHEKLVKKVHTVFDVVLADFDSTFIVEERPDEARNVLRGEIRDFVKKAEVTMNVMMEGELARATTECSG